MDEAVANIDTGLLLAIALLIGLLVGIAIRPPGKG